jgi:hypothetical protein
LSHGRRIEKKRRVEDPVAGPVIADDRLPLHDAIERKRKADRAVADQEEAIARARNLAVKADDHIRELRSKIEAADQTDVARAASLIKVDKPVASPWVGQSARDAVMRAERHLELTEAALKALHRDMNGLQDDAAEAQNSISVCIKQITAPLVAELVARLQAHKRGTLLTNQLLAVLLADGRAPRFNDESRSMKADRLRDAPHAGFKAEVERVRFGNAGDTTESALHLGDAIKMALTALQTDASAELPKV